MVNDIAEFKKNHKFDAFQKQSDFSIGAGKILENYFIFDGIKILNGKNPSSNDSYTLDNASKLFTLLNNDKNTVYSFVIRDNLTEDIIKEGFIISEYKRYAYHYKGVVNGKNYCSISYDHEDGIVQKNYMHLHCGGIRRYKDIFEHYTKYNGVDIRETQHHSIIIDDIEYYSSYGFHPEYPIHRYNLLDRGDYHSAVYQGTTNYSDPFFNAINNTTMEISLYV